MKKILLLFISIISIYSSERNTLKNIGKNKNLLNEKTEKILSNEKKSPLPPFKIIKNYRTTKEKETPLFLNEKK